MKPRAFTILELLFVVATIAVLAAIGVPNFLEAQVRSKVARTRTDMATLDASLRAYFSDFNTYPPNNAAYMATLEPMAANPRLNQVMLEHGEEPDTLTDEEEENDYDPFGGFFMPMRQGMTVRPDGEPSPGRLFLDSGADLTVLTTPVAYLTGVLPIDTFRNQTNRVFTYTDLAPFPVDDSDNPFHGITRRYVLMSPGPNSSFNSSEGPGNLIHGPYLPYDPTNGTVSAGDLFSVGSDRVPVGPGNFGRGMADQRR